MREKAARQTLEIKWEPRSDTMFSGSHSSIVLEEGFSHFHCSRQSFKGNKLAGFGEPVEDTGIQVCPPKYGKSVSTFTPWCDHG